jgi:hypothetical protein
MGDCDLRRKAFHIRISDRASYHEALDTLVHEWGHALSWSVGHPSLTAHDEHWGLAFSRVYRALYPDEPPEQTP